MSLPLSTTTLTVTRQESLTDPNYAQDLDSETDYVAANVSWVTVAAGLRANINAGSGIRAFGPGGERERVLFRFQADPVISDTIRGDDTITDASGSVYIVLWCRPRNALGVSYLEGMCYQEVGAL